MTEAEHEQGVIEYAQLNGWKIYHTRNSKGSVAGFPDLLLVRAGRLIFAELKTLKGKLTPAQEEWLDLLTEVSGIICYVWRPNEWPEIEEVLKR